MSPILLVGPMIEPISLAEARAWLKLDSTEEDDLVGALITSARLIVESLTRRMLLTQTWRLALDAWPKGQKIEIPFAPFRALTAIRVYDAADVAQSVPFSLFFLDAAPEGARIIFTGDRPAPGRKASGIEIDIVVGYGDAPKSVPAPLRQAMRLLVARWYDNRGDALAIPAQDALPAPVAALVAPYRRARLA